MKSSTVKLYNSWKTVFDSLLIRQWNHICAFLLGKIIRATIKHIPVFGIEFNNQITVSTPLTSHDIVLMHLIIRHEVTYFRLIGANPKVQPVILVELIFQRVTANRAPELEQIHNVHIQVIRMWQVVFLYNLDQETGGLVPRRDYVNPILGSCQSHIE